MQDAKRKRVIKKAIRRRGAHLLEAVRPPGVALKRRAPLPDRSATRLVASPVFVLSSVRSGSTLLRVLLNSHSRLRAPHELHLRTLKVEPSRKYSADIMDAVGLSLTELEHLLWDRVLHHELLKSRKSIIVDKTPSNALQWQRISSAWPEARYIFLQRHPASVVESLLNRRKDADRDAVVKEVLDYVTGVETARQSLEGLTVRYEDLTADPADVTKKICAYLGVPWESSMLDYGAHDHGPIKPVFGDWSANLKSGRIQRARPLPSREDVPEELREITRLWGY
ncbi:sulfotransferase family protein [Actinocorallia populi]|uniref:sulfotransferase family protein n=1 Tax=Actinocorallia populi TaxID=2079200 RepID=UPI000D09442C|nr:sulfotransferase [Actinocorallia populi]